jgi:predicted porin
MKKLLIATAALAMVAGTAQAQSSVSVYGGLGFSQNQTETAGVNGAVQNADRKTDYLGTTALGFTGTEDLGSGNKAFFRLEGDLSATGNLGTSTSTTANVNVFNRHAHIGIETKEFGTASFGRQNDSVKDLEGLGQVYNLSDNLHISTSVGDRYTNIMKYTTPTFSGLKASFSYSNNASNAASSAMVTEIDSAAATDGAVTLNSFALSYKYQNFDFGAGMGTLSAVGVSDVQTSFLGARGTFGKLTVGAHYAMNEEGNKELNQTMISANYTMGNIDLKGHYVMNSANDNVTNSARIGGASDGPSQQDGRGYGLMAVYNLSKRTAGFVGYADFNQTNLTTQDQKVKTVGLLHKF